MTLTWNAKAPSEVVTRQISWFGRLDGDTIATSVLTVLSGSITLSNVVNDTQTVTATISGGLSTEGGEVLSNTITTAGGLTLQEIITMAVNDPQATVIQNLPATTTKRIVVNMAFEEIGLAGYEFDATAEEQFSALRRLDGLLAEWRSANLDIGYNFPPVFGQGDLDDVYGAPDSSINIVAICLALRIMPAIGKTMSAETRLSMVQGMNALRAANATIPTRQLSGGTPIGAGNKRAQLYQPLTPWPQPL